MEDNSQPVSRLKQYYVVRDHSEKDIGQWKKNSIIELDPDVAIPYVGAGILVPLASAIATGLIPTSTTVASSPTTPPSTLEETPVTEVPKKKTLIKSSLKEAVAAKKDLEPPKSEAILTPSNAPTFTSPSPEHARSEPAEPVEGDGGTPQEQAIKAKIAALKKAKS